VADSAIDFVRSLIVIRYLCELKEINKEQGHMHLFDAEAGAAPFQKKISRGRQPAQQTSPRY
jgi:hypothetical protein